MLIYDLSSTATGWSGGGPTWATWTPCTPRAARTIWSIVRSRSVKIIIWGPGLSRLISVVGIRIRFRTGSRTRIRTRSVISLIGVISRHKIRWFVLLTYVLRSSSIWYAIGCTSSNVIVRCTYISVGCSTLYTIPLAIYRIWGVAS